MQPNLFDGTAPSPDPPDQAARDFAIDPAEHVVLEASAGTGKTRVLVDRYVRLIRDGVTPRHILAITFTRKAAAEMRERILADLRDALDASARGDVQITTIDAFCFGLLREFPLEADVDPGFEIADETEMARFAGEALDVGMRIARSRFDRDETLRLLFARIKPGPLRSTLARLLDSRHVAVPAVATFVARRVRLREADAVAAAFADRLRAVWGRHPGALVDGPHAAPEFSRLAADLQPVLAGGALTAAQVAPLRRRLDRYFLTKAGQPRKRLPSEFGADVFASPAARKRHQAAVLEAAPGVASALDALARDVDGILAVGLQAMLAIVVREYERLLDEHSVLDFAAMLDHAVRLLARQEEFARSRLKLQSRYHHLLVDEFQDTSRQQWRLVDLLLAAWGEGEGIVDGPTSIFIVGDRKQSIYRFRHAEVALLDEAARRVAALRPGRQIRRAISTNFRSVAELLAFVNALCDGMRGDPGPGEGFEYLAHDRFPVTGADDAGRRDGQPVVGLAVAAAPQAVAAAVADEVVRVLDGATVRDRQGPPRPARPEDIGILFRTRAGHQVYEEALAARGIRTYVYKGLGFFDAPEVQDVQAVLRYLARPDSQVCAAGLLRSRLMRVSDAALARMAPDVAGVLSGAQALPGDLRADDLAVLERAVPDVQRWRALTDRMSASLLVETILAESAYAWEVSGPRTPQARENLKKVRALIRRVESRGYATMRRLADHFETLRAGDESNAIVEARGCVQLMTMHAAKGLEFPVVFLVNLQQQAAGGGQPVHVIARGPDGEPEVAFRSTEGTRAEEFRDVEEQRRLLYVAVTRARDRLYLSAEIDPARRRAPARRSLLSLLPQGLQAAMAEAAAARPEVTEVMWAVDGRRFALGVIRAGGAHAGAERAVAEAGGGPIPVDRAALPAGPAVRLATRMVEPPGPLPGARPARGRSDQGRSDRVVGTLVHRLLQWAGAAEPDEAQWGGAFDRLAPVWGDGDAGTGGALRQLVIDTARAVRSDSRLRTLLGSGTCWYEVPWSWRPEGGAAVVRGVIDCVVEGADGRLTVVEIKTGRPRPEHDRQLALYVEALGAAFPGRRINGELVYPPAGD